MPNLLRVGREFTYIPTRAGFLYVAVVIDVWSRRVDGWSMRDDMATPLVTDTPGHGHRTAQTREGHPPPRIRGSQYTSAVFRARCAQAGIAVSMGRRGDAYDKYGSRIVLRLPRNRTPGPDQLPQREPGPLCGVRSHFEGFYNPNRLHPALGYHPPADYEPSTPTNPDATPAP